MAQWRQHDRQYADYYFTADKSNNPVSGSINTYSIQDSVSERIDFNFPCTLLASNVIAGQVFRTELLNPLPPNLNHDDDKIDSDHLPVLITFANPFDTAFQLLSITRTNQHATLQWESQNNRTFCIEASTDLFSWRPFATNLLTTTTNSPFVFSTNNVAGPLKFFRIYRVPQNLRIPDEARIIRDAFVSFKIPILGVAKSRNVAIKKNKLRTAIMQAGVNIIFLGDRRKPPHCRKAIA